MIGSKPVIPKVLPILRVLLIKPCHYWAGPFDPENGKLCTEIRATIV